MPSITRRLPIFPFGDFNDGNPIMSETTIEEESDVGRTTVTIVVERDPAGARYIAELLTMDTLIGLHFSGIPVQPTSKEH